MTLSPEFRRDVLHLEEQLQQPGAHPEHGLSSTKVTAVVDPAAVDYQRLCEFASHGNLVEVEVKSGVDYTARFKADALATFSADVPNEAIEALRGVADSDAQAAAAIESGHFLDLAAAIPEPTITVALTLRSPPGSSAFVWSTEALLALTDSWIGLAQLLALHADLVVLDATTAIITSESLAVRGPDAADPPQRAPVTAWDLAPWRLAAPSHFLPTAPANVPAAPGVASALVKLAIGVLWLRISVLPPTVTPGMDLGAVRIAFSHDPTGDVTVSWAQLPDNPDEAAKAIELWEWLDGDDRAGRLEAARQAATTSLRSGSDLRDGADTILRQARFLYDLSRRQAVAAIVDARRAARLATQNAAHTAAAEARASSRTTADRTVAAVIASLAVMVTHQTDVLSRSVSFLVLAAVLVGIIASLAHSFLFEFPATESALTATLAEVSVTQRDVLLTEDIDEFNKGAVVTDARGTLTRARVAAGVAGGLAVIAVVAGVLVVGIVAPREDARVEPTPSSTTVSFTTVAATPAPLTSVSSASTAGSVTTTVAATRTAVPRAPTGTIVSTLSTNP